MASKRIVVYGASGHGKVVADIVLSAGLSLAGFLDDDAARAAVKVLGLLVLGSGEWLRSQDPAQWAVALGIGDNHARRKVAQRCQQLGFELLIARHPAATIARSATLAAGAVVMAGAVINPDARIGAGAIINTGAVVEHDTVVGDYAHVSPQATMGGGSRLGALSQLGTGAVLLPLVSVGDETVVGAGAVVIRDLPDGVVAVGVPAAVRRSPTAR